jgi:hypothetical protein
MIKRVLIALGIVVALSLILLHLSFFRGGRDWFVDRSGEYIKNCKNIPIGSSINQVLSLMGKPDSRSENQNKVKLIYFTGGLKTETGRSFEFKNNILIMKGCGTE